MFTIALIVIAVAVVARLVTVVRHDRPLMTPRSHAHEFDQHLAGTLGAR